MFLYSLRYFYKHVLLDGLMLRAMDHIYTQSSSKLRAFSDTDVKKSKAWVCMSIHLQCHLLLFYWLIFSIYILIKFIVIV